MALLASRSGSEISQSRHLTSTLERTLEAWRAATCLGSATLSSQAAAADIDFLQRGSTGREVSKYTADHENLLARSQSTSGMQQPVAASTRAAGRALRANNSPRAVTADAGSGANEASPQKELPPHFPTPHADSIASGLLTADTSRLPPAASAVSPATITAYAKPVGASKGTRRAHFSTGPWQEKFGTADGHPDHEGLTARPQRACFPRYPVSLTASSIFALEAELEGTCPWSIDRLKRRVGLLPIARRCRPFITAPQKRLPPLHLRSPQRQSSALEAESDADSDSAFVPPSPSRRRRKLFPLSAEEAFAAANKAKAAATAATHSGSSQRKRGKVSDAEQSKRAKNAALQLSEPESPRRGRSADSSPVASPPLQTFTGLSQNVAQCSLPRRAQQADAHAPQRDESLPVRHRRKQQEPDEEQYFCSVNVTLACGARCNGAAVPRRRSPRKSERPMQA